MQFINREIQNPLFFIWFMGAAILLPVSCFMHFHQPLNTRFWLLLAATIFYIVGVIGVTALFNIPLNNALDKFNAATANAEELNRQKISFMVQWNRWHSVRTIAAVMSLVSVLGACVSRES
jgi:uncharacterized membrane protein